MTWIAGAAVVVGIVLLAAAHAERDTDRSIVICLIGFADCAIGLAALVIGAS